MIMLDQNRITTYLRFFKLFCFLGVLVCGTAPISQKAAADTLQHSWAGDIPIMHGLKIEPELGFAFDSPNGRIVMIFASTKVSLSEIMAFYDGTLVQLGWKGGSGSWLRGAEKLAIGVVQTARGPLWRIMLKPF